MKELISVLAGVFLFLSLALVSSEGQKKTSTKEDRLTGTVHMIDKETSTIVIRKGAVQCKVIWRRTAHNCPHKKRGESSGGQRERKRVETAMRH